MTSSPHTPSLTHVVSVRRLAGSVLQARQDLSLPHIAVSHQQELEQKVVRSDRAASVAHPRGRWQLPRPIMRRDSAACNLPPPPPPLAPVNTPVQSQKNSRDTRKVQQNKSAMIKVPPRSTAETVNMQHTVWSDCVQRASSVQRETPTTIRRRALCHPHAQDAPRFYARR